MIMEKNESKIKFNIVDVVILILILALIATLVWFFFFRNTSSTVDQQKNVEYTVILKNIKSGYTGIFKTGEKIYNSSSGNSFGTIKKVEIKKSTSVLDSYHTDEKGNKIAEIGEYDEYFDIYLTVTGKVFVSEQGVLLLDGNKLLIGSPLFLKDGNFAQTAYVVSFKVTD